MVMLYSTLVWIELEFYTQFWEADLKKKKVTGESSEEKQRIKYLKKNIFEKKLSELGMFILQPKKTEKAYNCPQF